MVVFSPRPPTLMEQQQPEGGAPQLTSTDLRNLVLLLDVCSARGVWKASEMSQVGAIYDRLTAAAADAAGTEPNQQNQQS